MATVFLDLSALYLRSETSHPVVAPGAERAIELLRTDGHDVIVIGRQPGTPDEWLRRLPRSDHAMPASPEREPAWLVVGDRTRCGTHHAGLRTVLVGGGPVPRSGRGRCDLETADLHGAVLAVIGGAAIAGLDAVGIRDGGAAQDPVR